MTAAALEPYTALVLAAQRQHADDPLAHRSGGRNKNFIPIAGRPMIDWVLETLLDHERIRQVVVSIEEPELLRELPRVRQAIEDGRLRVSASGSDLYESVRWSLGDDAAFPAIVTTADNPLLSVAMVDHFCRLLDKNDPDAAIAMTRADVLRAEYPDGQRRFYDLSDGEYSNCNLYAIRRPEALAAAEMFRGGGQFRKKASRMVRAFGIGTFLRYRFGRLSLDNAAARLSRGFGIDLRFVIMPFAEACIDVDNERTFNVASEILQNRSSAADNRPPVLEPSPTPI